MLCHGGLRAQGSYALPPEPIPQILDAPPLPSVAVGPDHERLLLMERPSMPSIRDLSQPMLRLAGARINPATSTRFGAGGITGLMVERIDDRSPVRIETPDHGEIEDVLWSPGGERIGYTVVGDDGVELWVADVASGRSTRLTGPVLNGAASAPCEWLPSGDVFLCTIVPDDRGRAPAEPAVPPGPVIQESRGREAPVRTYQDLLESPHDVALFEHYFTAQLASIDATTGDVTPIGQPAIFRDAEASPDGRFILIDRVVRPFSYLVPIWDFPHEIEIWSSAGRLVRTIASLPLAENVPIRGMPTGPRSVEWRPLADATLLWAEALDGGDPDRDVEHRDRLLVFAAPFETEPREWLRLGERYAGIDWGRDGLALVSDYDRSRRWRRTFIADADEAGSSLRMLWDRSTEDVYGDPGDPLMERTARGERVMVQSGDAIFLVGDGATPEGERPFLDRLDLRTLETERLWRSDADHFEEVVALLDEDAGRILTRRESPTEPPNYYRRDLEDGTLVALTEFEDPMAQLRGIEKRLLVYQRDDGVTLSGELYLPPDYEPAQRLPVVVWAYPREFTDADAASQVRAAPNRFDWFRGASHMFFLTQGYAVFDGPAMPIIGGDTANNTYIEQLVASARAAVDTIVAMGVADRDRIGIGGHSYGAFMTANLLAHSDLFRAGIARSGAYNRTLTPFGFQNETRTYWQASDVYERMSPFMHAQQIDEPLLLIHGVADNNSGTFPVQSERLYHAVKGLGGIARLVMLPHESHGYRARESVLHTLAEMVAWFDQHVKNAPRRTDVTSPE
ncbi:MAG: prolyl oligopeptidase family serine peptidase [Longimicrobiales bacterium]